MGIGYSCIFAPAHASNLTSDTHINRIFFRTEFEILYYRVIQGHIKVRLRSNSVLIQVIDFQEGFHTALKFENRA